MYKKTQDLQPYFNFISLILVFCIYNLCSLLYSQNTNSYFTQKYSTENGLQSNLISDLHFDNNGFMWLATQAGISRFDGSSFVNYNFNSDSSFLSNRFINIYKQANGKLYALNDAMQLFEINSFSKLNIIKNKKYGKDFIVLGNKDIFFLNSSISLKPDDIENNIKDINFLYTVNNKDFYKVFENFALYNEDTICKNSFYHFNTRYMFVYKDYFGVISKKNDIVLFKNGVLFKQYSLEKLLKNKIDINRFFINQFDEYITFNFNESVYLFQFIDSEMKVDLMPFNAKLYHDYTYVRNNNNVFYYSQKNGLFKVMKSYFDCYSDSTFETRDIYRVVYLNNSIILKNDVFSLSYHFTKNKKSIVFNIHKDTICVLLNDTIYYVSEKSIKKYKLEFVNTYNKSYKFNEFTDYYQFKSQFYVISNNKVFILKNRKVLELVFSYPNKTLKTICKLNADNGWLLGVKNEGLIYYNSIHNKTYKLNFFNNKDIRIIQYDYDLGVYWVFTYGSGVYILTKDLRVKKFFTDENNYMRFSHYLLKDSLNYYWIPTNNGLFRFNQKNIKTYLKSPNKKILYQYFNKYFGIINNEFNGRFVNSGVVLPNGNLAFSSMEGVVIVNPNKISSSNSSFPILIDQILLNGEKLNLNSVIKTKEGFKSFVLEVSTPHYLPNSYNILEYKIPELINEWTPVVNNTLEILSLKHGEYKICFRKKGDQNQANYKTLVFIVSSHWYSSYWAFIVYFLLFILLGYVISRNYFRIRQRNLKNELILMESELKALRAQINPHYLSNSLVSLQQLILKDNKLQALEVLSRYGKVMRSILNNSEHPFVSLYTETSTLKEYMELEALLLFEDSEFKIHYETIDNELLQSIQIPSMLIQPYVENAIIHGLIPKNKGPYQLSVSFEFNERLICTIQDNGIGRSPQVQNSQRISKGNKNVENRLKLYGKLLQQTMTVEIVDLKNELNEPIGTKVVVLLPHSFNENKHQ